MNVRKKQKKRALFILEIALAASFVVLLIWSIASIAAQRRIRAEERQAAARFAPQAVATAQPEIHETKPQNQNSAIQPEIAELMQENPDAVGLLHFEGDRTLYVCQTTDNYYYMNHRFDRSEDPAGMIYMDHRNSLWPRSDNLILYGHNMRDGSRFGTLRRFEKWDYLKKYPIFQLVDRHTTLNYVPFAIFHTTVLQDDPAYYPFDRTNFVDQADFEQYVEDVRSRSVLDLPVEVSYGDRLLTLATCHSSLERGRLVIVCREVKPGEYDGA